MKNDGAFKKSIKKHNYLIQHISHNIIFPYFLFFIFYFILIKLYIRVLI
jgi:fucose 4-O-acetylase-like acetyltransferase